MARVLIAEDDQGVAYTLKAGLAASGHAVEWRRDGQAALEELRAAREPYDVVITDLMMPRLDGLQLLDLVRAGWPELAVVLITAVGDERKAVQAMKRGAVDYFKKPFDLDEVEAVVERAAEAASLRREVARLRSRAEPEAVFTAPAMQRVRELAERVADKDVTVLITGETGTGKEVLADLIQSRSRRAGAPYVKLHCGAVPETLAESELFGYERGAFTGAHRQHRGAFQRAHGGTLLLDEIGDVPLAVQGKLLRAVQQGELQPLGAEGVSRVDVRLLAATRRDLARDSSEGRFREDLFFRLNVVQLRLPPLRERREDIPPMVRRFLLLAAVKFAGPNAAPLELDPEALDLLVRREWPGNARELQNAIERLVALATGPLIGPEDVALLDGEAGRPPAMEGGFREKVAAFELDLIRRALADASGNQSDAARRLGLSRVTLLDRMRRLGLR
jgi:DNA-binding NtrC family response regulator